MLGKALGSGLLAVVASAGLMVASALPATAQFTVSVKGKTITVTQTEANTLFVILNPIGELEVSDGGPVSVYPPPTNLVVRGPDTVGFSFLNVVLNSALTGSLTLDLPGESAVTVSGGTTTIGGALKVKGSDVARQYVTLGAVGAPVTINGNASFDMRGGNDSLSFEDTASILGSFTSKGLNRLDASTLRVGGSFSMNCKRESDRLEVLVDELVVGKSLTVIGSPVGDNFYVQSGSVGRNVTVKLAEFGTFQSAFLLFDTIGGNLTGFSGTGQSTIIETGLHTVVKGSVNLTTLADRSHVYLRGAIQGTAIKYTGGAGEDYLQMTMIAPRAKATIKLKGGDDELVLIGPDLQLGRLAVDFGEGSDHFDQGGLVLPPGSTIEGLP